MTDMDTSDFCHPFDQLVQRAESEIRVVHANLLFSADHSPHLKACCYLEQLDELARRVEGLRARTPCERIAALRAVLVDQGGFRGNCNDYYDPRNSFIHDVMDRRVGIPISLSAIWLDVCRQLGWPFVGIGLPGHFIVGYRTRDEEILLDPYCGGRLLSRSQCQSLVSALFGRQTTLVPEHFATTGPRATLARMLENLRCIFTRRRAWHSLLCALMRLRALQPDRTCLAEDIAQARHMLAKMN